MNQTAVSPLGGRLKSRFYLYSPPSRSYPLHTSLNPYKLEYLKVLLGKKRLNNDYAYHE